MRISLVSLLACAAALASARPESYSRIMTSCRVQSTTGQGAATATCSASEQVISGGCTSFSSLTTSTFALKISQKQGRTRDVIGWTCASWFPGSSITADVLCCPPQPQQAAQACDYSDVIVSGRAVCPGKKQAISGGCTGTTVSSILGASTYSASFNGWDCSLNPSSGTYTGLAMCCAPFMPTATQIRGADQNLFIQSALVPQPFTHCDVASASGSIVTCPLGKQAVNGACYSSPSGQLYQSTWVAGSQYTSWQCQGRFPAGGSVVTSALCCDRIISTPSLS